MKYISLDKFHLIDTKEFSNIIVNIRKDLMSLEEIGKYPSLTEFKDIIAIGIGDNMNLPFNNYSHLLKKIALCKNHSDYEIFKKTTDNKYSNGGYLLSFLHFFIGAKYKISPRITKMIIDRHIGRTQKKNIYVVYQGISYSIETIKQFQVAYNYQNKDIAVICFANNELDSLSIYNSEIIKDDTPKKSINVIDFACNHELLGAPDHLIPGARLGLMETEDDKTQLMYPNEAIKYQLERLKHKNKGILANIVNMSYIDRNFRMRIYLDELSSNLMLNENFSIRAEICFFFELFLEDKVIYGTGDLIYSHLLDKKYISPFTVESQINLYEKIIAHLEDKNINYDLNIISHNKDYLCKIFKNKFYTLQEAICMTTNKMDLELIIKAFNLKNSLRFLSPDFQKKYSEKHKIFFTDPSKLYRYMSYTHKILGVSRL